MTLEMTIGQLAAAAGVHVETVRYYQRRHLLPVPPRTGGRIARYPGAALRRLRFIKRSQALGFSLDDVNELLSLDERRACHAARGIAERKLAEVRRHIERLQSLEESLQELVGRCSASRPRGMGCPLLESLMRDES